MMKSDYERSVLGLSFSVALHLLVFFFMLLKIPVHHLEEEQIISFDVLPIGEINNIPLHKKQQKSINPDVTNAKEIINRPKLSDKSPDTPPVKEETAAPSTPAPQTPPESLKDEKLEKIPAPQQKVEPSQKAEKIKDDTARDPAQEAKIKQELQEVKKPEPKVPEQKPQNPPVKVQKKEPLAIKPIKPKSKALSDSDLDSLLKNLEKSSEGSNNKSTSRSQKATQGDAKKDSKGKYDESVALSVNESAFIKQKISDAWNLPPIDKATAEQIQITTQINLVADGSVQEVQIQIIECGSVAASTCQAVVNSALRAIQQASPFIGLAPERYNIWKEFSFIFLPSKMFQ